ncbi:MAG: ferritin [Isosphaera sp.]|nr:ferritin [Isosphaera sp.]
MPATHTHPPDACDTGALNALLRGELSAVETYDQAMSKFEDQKVLADLQKIREEHARAAGVLREKVVRFGAEPAGSSGPWGAFAAAVTGAAQALGPSTALAALRQGEEHGVNEYEDALGNDAVHPDCKEMIRTDLLPRCRGHVDELNRLMGGMT